MLKTSAFTIFVGTFGFENVGKPDLHSHLPVVLHAV